MMEIYWERYQFPLRNATVEIIREITVEDEQIFEQDLMESEEEVLDYNS